MRILGACVLFMWTATAFGQTFTERYETPPPNDEQKFPNRFELNAFTGASYFRALDDPFKTKLVRGGTLGVRFTENWWKRWSIEVGANLYGVNNVRLQTTPNSLDFGNRLFQLALNPVYHFADRTARVRPYVTAGIGTNVFYPTSDAKAQVKQLANPAYVASLSGLDTSHEFGMNYGGGVKVRLTEGGRVGLRFDVRALLSDNPHFRAPMTPGFGAISIPDGTLHGIQPTVGLNLYFGKAAPPQPVLIRVAAPPPPPPPPPPPVRNNIAAGAVQGPADQVCGGTPVNLSITASMTPAAFPVRYQWTVNGTASGTNANTLTFTAPDAGGDQRVAVQISDASGSPNASNPVTANYTVRVRPYVRPTIRATVSGADIRQGQTVTATAVGTGDCGGPLVYSWTASDGQITANPQNPLQATFDSTRVTFPGTTDRDQVKEVTLTASVRDGRNSAATTTAPVRVSKPAEMVRLPDILFTAGSARVNNCGKRILLDEVFPRLRSGNYTIMLVGHSDVSDRNVANLDRERAYNAARVLVTGADTQTRVPPTQIKADWVGRTQAASKEPGLCGTSTRTEVKERSGGSVRQGDAAAENRRVEVWLVPTGSNLVPVSVSSAKDLPATIRPPRR